MRRGGRRLVAVRVEPPSRCELRVSLRQDGGRVGPRRKAKLAVGSGSHPPAGRGRGAARARRASRSELIDGAGDSATERFRLRLPAPR